MATCLPMTNHFTRLTRKILRCSRIDDLRLRYISVDATQINLQCDPVSNHWRIVSAVCVQRFPSICRVKTSLEKEFYDMQIRLQIQKSRLSDFEVEEKDYLEKKLAREKKAMEEDLDVSQVSKMEGATDFEELQEAKETELQNFRPQSRETAADKKQDFQSLQRKLDQILYLLVKKPRQSYMWQMPQGGLDPGESLIQAAQRELEEECGTDLKVQFLSNSPVAFHNYKHNTEKDSIFGSKVFFFKAQYVSGSVKLNLKELEQYVWVTKEEMKQYVSNDYYNAIAPALMD